MAGNYDEAVADYEKYLSEFPKGASVEDVNYRIALSALFAGKYQDAMDQLQDYVKNHPSGRSSATQNIGSPSANMPPRVYDEVITDCQAWEKQFPNNQQLGEVLALLGDAYAASDREADAIPIYIRSYKLPPPTR